MKLVTSTSKQGLRYCYTKEKGKGTSSANPQRVGAILCLDLVEVARSATHLFVWKIDYSTFNLKRTFDEHLPFLTRSGRALIAPPCSRLKSAATASFAQCALHKQQCRSCSSIASGSSARLASRILT